MKMLKLMFERKKSGLTQKQLAEKVGVSFQTIVNYENGRRKPNSDMLLKLSEALGCSVSDIL